jgi:hypothetical protein
MWNADKVTLGQNTGGGNVIAYNYMDDAWLMFNPNLPESGVNSGHDTCSHMDLMEGNYCHKLSGDSYWGNDIDMTVFRNWFSGLRAAHLPLINYKNDLYGNGSAFIHYVDTGGQTGRNCVDVLAFCLRYNFVGNILGFGGAAAGTPYNGNQAQGAAGTGGAMSLLPGYTDGSWTDGPQVSFVYETLSALPGSKVSMWAFGGFQQGDSNATPFTWVPNSHQTHLRQGNYDYVTNSQIWYANPIGASGSTSTGTAQTILNSMYLTAKPAFFGGNPWPWVDPATGRTTTLPAKARFEAGTPNVVT